MARKKVLIGVGPNGEIEVEAVGFKDSSCFAATKDFEDAIGTKLSVEKKPEAARKAKRRVKSSRKTAKGLPSGWCG